MAVVAQMSLDQSILNLLLQSLLRGLEFSIHRSFGLENLVVKHP